MSLDSTIPTLTVPGFPRASGDEPDTFLKECADQAFSPRERG